MSSVARTPPRLLPALAFAVALLGAAGLRAAAAPALDVLRVPLGEAQWTRNGVEPTAPPPLERDGERRLVALPFDARGVRWATSFDTETGSMARLLLDWTGAPDGLLFEIVIDGQRLVPPQDSWRPSPRALRTDLGSVWLGPGGHLLELVAREEPIAAAGETALDDSAHAVVRVAALEAQWLP